MFAERIAVRSGRAPRVVLRSARAVRIAADLGADVTMLQLLPALVGALLELGDAAAAGRILSAAHVHARTLGLDQLVLDPGFERWLDERVLAVDRGRWAAARAAGRELDREALLAEIGTTVSRVASGADALP
jgi:hypothetical protein